jgi:hypothetical protein
MTAADTSRKAVQQTVSRKYSFSVINEYIALQIACAICVINCAIAWSSENVGQLIVGRMVSRSQLLLLESGLRIPGRLGSKQHQRKNR